MEEYVVVNPMTIKVKDGLPRLRKEMGKIKDMVDSFKKYGQLQPIVCTRNLELIAGGRRLATCVEAEMDVKVVFADTLDPIVMREMELEENIQRKSLTPAEEIMAVQELHRIKQAIYGETIQGTGGGWTMQDTAETIGRTRTSVVDDLALARALEDFPVLAGCKTKSEIRKAMKGLERVSQSVAALGAYEEKVSGSKIKFELYHEDAVKHIKSMGDSSVNVLMTDPPYGIDIHNTTIGIGGHSGGDVTTSGFKYDDSFENAMLVIGEVAKESYRVVRSDGFAFVFCAISNFWIIRSMFEAVGWNCSQRPIIWIKNESGQNNAPDKWMSAGYESMLFARRIDSQIVVPGKVDWIQFPNVNQSVRLHQAEKPVPMLKELLSRVTMSGAVVYDPFCGSGSTLQASLELNLYPIGCDSLIESFAVAKKRMVDYIKMKGE
jgi:site-specific DNA-methyltransferase (adenine-specific)